MYGTVFIHLHFHTFVSVYKQIFKNIFAQAGKYFKIATKYNFTYISRKNSPLVLWDSEDKDIGVSFQLFQSNDVLANF